MSVGVDAALSPAGCNHKIARTVGENAQRPVGADASVRPMGTTVLPQRIVKMDVRRAGRCGHRPLQTLCVFALVRSILQVHTAGRTGSSAPTGCVPFRIGAPVSATLYRAGGVEPLPYGNGGRLYGIALVHSNLPVRTAQSFRHGFAVPPPFTQGRLGAVQTRRRSRNLQKAGRASPAPTLRQILYFFLTG